MRLRVLILIMCVLVSPIANSVPIESIVPGDIELIQSNRVSRVEMDYIYRLQVTNSGNAVTGLTAVVSTTGPGSSIVEGNLVFDDLAAGQTASSTDTFTLRQDRRFAFDPDALQFDFDGTLINENQVPVAHAGPDQTLAVGAVVTLDGTQSSDLDGDALTFQWSFVEIPANSNTSLSNADQPQAQFTLDVPGQYSVQLIVSDGQADSAPDQVVISSQNSAPQADAGAAQTARVGDRVVLDGSGSADVDGDTLSYHWQLIEVPAGSAAVLDDVNVVNPQFSVDRAGTYRAQLIVNDGSVDSLPSVVEVSTENTRPIANAGSDKRAALNDTVILDASASTDADGDALSYQWSIVAQPNGSTSQLDDATALRPTLLIDVPGSFVIQLVVNDGQLDSDPDTVIISTENTRPVANAGPDQSVVVNTLVQLDGSTSNDIDGDPLSFRWSIVSKPSASAALIGSPNDAQASLLIDAPGDYVLQLIVNDAQLDSDPDTMMISTVNARPVANAGSDTSIQIGRGLTLDGRQSTDADLDVLSFQWSVTSMPTDSVPTLQSPNSATPTFIADKVGDYTVQLIVNDGQLPSLPDVINIEAIPPEVQISASATSGSAPLDVQLNAIPLGGSAPYVYQWDLDGDGATDDSRKTFNYTFNQQGDVTITLNMTDAKGFQASASQLMRIRSAPVVLAAANPNTGSAPLNVQFSATSSDADGTIVRNDWDFNGDGTTDFSSPNSASVSHIYQNPGRYSASLTVTDNDGLSTTDVVIISVGVAPQVTATANPLGGIAPLSIDFSGAVSDSDGEVVLYEWDFDGDRNFDFSSSESASANNIYLFGGVYNATLRVSDNDGLIGEDSVIITVAGPPASLPSAYPLTGNAPLTVTFFSDGKDFDGGPEYYDWDFDGDGSFDRRLIASQNTTFTYTQPGVYAATLQVVDNDGLTSSASINITVTDGGASTVGMPVVSVAAKPTNGGAPLAVLLAGAATDPNGSIVLYEWDFESDGIYDFVETASGLALIDEAIDVGSYAHQAFADFDADNDLDMIVGNSSGQLTYFRNDGNANQFQFTDLGLVQDGAASTIDVGSYAAPFTYDIDADGDMDLVVGNSAGQIYIIENTGSTTIPNWENQGLFLLSNGSALDVGSYAKPYIWDAGQDGDWDLWVGNSGGQITLVENTASAANPSWSNQGLVVDRDALIIDVGSYAVPWMFDHDGDGDADVYIGDNSGRLTLLENEGTDANPSWLNQGLLTDNTGATIDVGSYATPIVTPTSGLTDWDLWVGNSAGQLTWIQSPRTFPLAWSIRASAFNHLDVGGYAAPALVDYDNNGVMDLVVGNSNGNIRLILNLGSTVQPIYRDQGFMVDDQGTLIDVGSYAAPTFFDIDNDGDQDMLLGDSVGRLTLYRNNGGSPVPSWMPEGNLNDVNGSLIDVGGYSKPVAYDLDGDGDQDLYVGNSSGQIRHLENSGTVSAPQWIQQNIVIDSNNTAIDVGGYASPLLADINGDGFLELVVGSSNGVLYRYETTQPGIPLSWVLQDVQFGQVDIGSYASPVAINLDQDTDLDLIIGNSAGLIQILKVVGNVSHTYLAEGDHTATLRVTDNDANQVTKSVIISVFPAGFPSVVIEADVSEGLVPLAVNFTTRASDPDGSIVSYEWDFDGDGNFDLDGSAQASHTYTEIGVFMSAVRVTDDSGNQVTHALPITANLSVTIDHNAVINPELGERSTITSVLNSQATISLNVVDELGNVVKPVVQNQLRSAGTYTDSWDGINTLNNQVPDGVYYLVLEYSHNGVSGQIDARAQTDFIQYTPSRTWPGSFNPYKGIPVTSTYTVNKPSEVSYYFWTRDNSRSGSTIAPVRTLFIRELKDAGAHTEIWDGVNDKGVPVTPGQQYPITLWVYEFADNAIVVTGSKPVISALTVANRIFNPVFNPYSTNAVQSTTVGFELSKNASMEVAVIDQNGIRVNRFTKQDLTAGPNSVRWDGRNFDAQLVPAGVYSLELTAVDQKGNRSIPRYAIVTVRY